MFNPVCGRGEMAPGFRLSTLTDLWLCAREASAFIADREQQITSRQSREKDEYGGKVGSRKMSVKQRGRETNKALMMMMMHFF